MWEHRRESLITAGQALGTPLLFGYETFTALLLMAIASTMLTVPVVYPKLRRVAQLIFKTS